MTAGLGVPSFGQAMRRIPGMVAHGALKDGGRQSIVFLCSCIHALDTLCEHWTTASRWKDHVIFAIGAFHLYLVIFPESEYGNEEERKVFVRSKEDRILI
jgi:hypothetical protein